MKKLCNLLLTLAVFTLCFVLLPLNADAADAADLVFTPIYDGEEYAVTASRITISGELVIPSTYNGVPVTTIDKDAFADRTGLTSVVIPSSVYTINQGAFDGCTGLTSITIPGVIYNLGYQPFKDCNSIEKLTISEGSYSVSAQVIKAVIQKKANLKEVVISDTVETIGDSAFAYYSGLTSITIGNGVKKINKYAFQECTGLVQVKLPETVTDIGDYAFYSCTGLVSINLPDSVKNIGAYAFYTCSSLTAVSVPNGIETVGSYVFANCTNLSSISVPIYMTTSVTHPFSQCTNIKELTFTGGFTEISSRLVNRVISNKSNLEKVSLPVTVTAISDSAFDNYSGLTDVYYDGTRQQWNAIAIGKFNDPLLNATLHLYDPCAGVHTEEPLPGKKPTLTEPGLTEGKKCSVCGETLTAQEEIPALLTFALHADGESYSLTACNVSVSGEVVIPATYNGKPVTAIGEAAFELCTELTAVTIPNSITSIGDDAFRYCEKLTAVAIPDSVTSIGMRAFFFCSSLAEVSIGSGVTAIDTRAFHLCPVLTAFVVSEANPGYSTDSKGVLYTKDKSTLIQAPGALSGVYTVDNGTTTISRYAFANVTGLTGVVLPNGMEIIGDSAFKECTALTAVNLPESLLEIRYGAFSGCTALPDISLPVCAPMLGDFAFSGCTSLKKITVPKGYRAVGMSMFADCTGLESAVIYESAVISDGVTGAGDFMFQNCTGLQEVTFFDDVTAVGYGAFSGCSSLSKVYYFGTQAQWNTVAVQDNNDPIYHAELIVMLYNPDDVEAYVRSATVTKTSGANIWSQPYSSGNSKLVRAEKYTAKVNVIAKVVNASGGLWYQLSDGNWVYSTNVRITDYNPADAESCKKTFVVTSWGANIWSKPYSSGDSKVVKTVEKTATLSVVAQVRNSTGGLWYQLDDIGWIYSNNVTEQIYEPAKVIAFKRSATVMVTSGANVWGQPSTKAPSKVARVAAYTTKLNVVAKYTTPTGGLWYQLTDGNWVYSTNIRITDYNTADVETYKKTIVVTSWGANVWSKPYSSGDSKVVKTVAKNAKLTIVAKVRNSTYGLWYQLSDGGWIYSNNVAVK